MGFNLGINVIEVQGQAAPSIQPAETSVTGFIIRSRRGVDGGVVRVSSWTGFLERFGAHSAGAMGAYAIAGFFANGGTVAYVTRLLPAGPPDDSEESPARAASAAERSFPGTVDGSSSDGVMTLVAAYRGDADPGSWGNDIAIRIDGTEEGRRSVTLRYPGADGEDVETYEDLDFSSAEGREDVRERINTNSRYVAMSAAPSGIPDPTFGAGEDAEPIFVTLGDSSDTAGTDGTFAEGEVASAAIAALARYETEEIQLLACPETASETFSLRAMDHCERMGDRFFVGHVRDVGSSLDTSALRGDKRYGALYGPLVYVSDPLGRSPKLVPPTGHILGVYARTARERGIWKAPAGDAARLRGVFDVEAKVSDTDHTHLVKKLGVNLVRPIPGKGIVIDSARTLSTNTKWLHVNVRLLFNFVKSSLKRGLRWVVGEPNDENLWGRIEFDALRPFLLGLWRAGAFGPGAPEQVFSIKVDAENNTPADIEQGRLNVEVFFYPSRPAETIVVRVGQQQGASTTSEG